MSNDSASQQHAGNVRPFVSVIVPTHGRPELLSRLLESLKNQDYPHDSFEVIVVHNVSEDDTEDRVRKSASNSPVEITYHAKNFRNPAPSREFGARSARGEILAFIDDDCEATQSWISAGVHALVDGVGVVQGRTLPRPDQPRRFLERTIHIPEPTPIFETCNIFYRRDAFERAGGFSPEFYDWSGFGGEDTDLGWKVTELGFRSGFANDALVYHEVFHVTLKNWLLESKNMYVWPYLVKKHPDLRQHMYLGYFLSKRSALFDLAVVGLFLSSWTPTGALLAMPYVVYRLMEPYRTLNPLVRIARFTAGVPRGAVLFGAVVFGTVRYRSILL